MLKNYIKLNYILLISVSTAPVLLEGDREQQTLPGLHQRGNGRMPIEEEILRVAAYSPTSSRATTRVPDNSLTGIKDPQSPNSKREFSGTSETSEALTEPKIVLSHLLPGSLEEQKILSTESTRSSKSIYLVDSVNSADPIKINKK